jgi:RNA polymerase sigma-70 factor (ECF subfamily)
LTFRFWRKTERYWKLSAELKAYALALTRNEFDAEDLVQDILLKIHEGIRLPPDDLKAKFYAFRMLRNLHIDNLRKSKVRVEYSAEQERLYTESAGVPFDHVEQLIVREAFAKLTREHREILFLVDVMGFKYADAAETLDVAVGTIMSRISRARANMIEQLDGSKVQSLNERRKKRN